MTSMKSRRPLAEVTRAAPNLKQSARANNLKNKQTEQTVEQYLEEQCGLIIKDLRQHGAEAIQNLRDQHMKGVQEIQALINTQNSTKVERISVVLKCIGGPHLSQKFRLEMADDLVEDVFKMGRSTGRHFKEHGVSLYKDKEISTTHARIEIRNGQVFLIDNKSTNGTQLNNDDIDCQVPYVLKAGDVITMGGSELEVIIHKDFEEDTASV